MSADNRLNFLNELTKVCIKGCDEIGVTSLEKFQTIEQLGFIQEDLQETISTEADEKPLPLLELLGKGIALRAEMASSEPVGSAKEFKQFQESKTHDNWKTELPGEVIYSLVPELRRFSKRVKPEHQIDYIQVYSQRGTLADLRLLQVFLKKLVVKGEDAVADAIAKAGLPAFGKQILTDLWATLVPDSRTFLAAYTIDIEATLNRILEKSGKKAGEKSNQIMKAVDTLLHNVLEEGATVGPESLPMLKLGLKYAPDAAYRRRIAETIVAVGEPALDCLEDLINAFERGGLARDHHFIPLLAKLGKESRDVADALARALEDRDVTVRLRAAFNIGLLGSPAATTMRALEDTADTDVDNKVREQATKTLTNLRIRFQLLNNVLANGDTENHLALNPNSLGIGSPTSSNNTFV